jgi:predicted SnoaL-like aldol condensation-catalyzing enzyme
MAEEAMTVKDVVGAAMSGIYDDADVGVVDRLFSPSFRQHGVWTAEGPDGVRAFISSLPQNASCAVHRVLADADMVATHASYENLGTAPLVGFELWRLEDGRIVEHWDSYEPLVAETASGNSQVDGPTEPDAADSAATKALADEIVQTILVENDFSRLDELLAGEDYIQHNPRFGNGISGLATALAQLAEQGISMQYTARHRAVAEGDFALILSEGLFGGERYTFYDLFRVANGRAVEHWDVMTPEPKELRHQNGLY